MNPSGEKDAVLEKAEGLCALRWSCLDLLEAVECEGRRLPSPVIPGKEACGALECPKFLFPDLFDRTLPWSLDVLDEV
jgi:hypothetical protein